MVDVGWDSDRDQGKDFGHGLPGLGPDCGSVVSEISRTVADQFPTTILPSTPAG